MSAWRVGILALGMIAAACVPSSSVPESDAGTLATVTTAAAVTVPSTVVGAEAIYERVAPSLAYVETSMSSGSGVLLSGGRLLTAAHVVWPFDEVRVFFPDGTTISDARVIGTDLVADLALIDLGDPAGLPPAAPLGLGTELNTGAIVYQIGFPAEIEEFPEAAISSGIVSRKRYWESFDWTFVQSDAPLAGGQSGGALVSQDGQVVGITNFLFGGVFGLSAEISAVMDRVALMGDAANLEDLVGRYPPRAGERTTEAEIALDHFFDQQIWVIDEQVGTDVVVEARTNNVSWMVALAADGFWEASSVENDALAHLLEFTVSLEGPLFLIAGSGSLGEVTGTIESSVPMVEWIDVDDGLPLVSGDTYFGNIDVAGETDWYVIDLQQNQAVTIEVDALGFDPTLSIDSTENSGEPLAVDFDSGRGFFGWNPRVVFTAPITGQYLIAVEDVDSTGPGGYFITVE
ncbi:MAG: hypothetical protein HKN07_01145 [Acidimicrobiia bacterium]|nr:trypsin-like peptidase domain-containing protein [Acidimicrobiia bacterium]NNF62838.1 hypothetical protein [Acidimicrobiia bacterium]